MTDGLDHLKLPPTYVISITSGDKPFSALYFNDNAKRESEVFFTRDAPPTKQGSVAAEIRKTEDGNSVVLEYESPIRFIYDMKLFIRQVADHYGIDASKIGF